MGRKNITSAIMLIREPVPLSAFKETNKSDHIKESSLNVRPFRRDVWKKRSPEADHEGKTIC